MRALADHPFFRTTGAPLVPGNRVRLLKDAKENYPAWLDAIRSAERTIHFESYIIHDDVVGREFVEALAERARAGVRVRVVYDWLGALGRASRRLWSGLRQAGAEVRCFNPPRLDSPFGWLGRDHRKMLTVDGRVGFVSGLCVGRQWVGDPQRGIAPWRDTGVEIRGPAVADIERAFAQTWAATGEPIPPAELAARSEAIAPGGDATVRIVATVPNTWGLYRLDQLVAAIARRSIWLTDAYFVGTTSYVQALRAAARDGVDVRLLVPHASDVWLVGALSRAGYRPLLEAGVRVFEWNGPMLHAKTAVADGRWARVGSSNLNLASWVGNWELDVVVEDERFARAMEAMYLDDLAQATEIALDARRRPSLAGGPPARPRGVKAEYGSAGRAAAGVLSLGNTVGAAITNHRLLGPAESTVMVHAGLLLLLLAAVAVLWPPVIAFPLAGLSGWVAAALLVKAYRLRARRASAPEAAAEPAARGR